MRGMDYRKTSKQILQLSSKSSVKLIVLILISFSLSIGLAAAKGGYGETGFGGYGCDNRCDGYGNGSDGYCTPGVRAHGYGKTMVGRDGYCHPGVGNDGYRKGKENKMTGGGELITGSKKAGVSVTHGFELYCDAGSAPNNFQVNWGKGNKFHLDSILSSYCWDDPDIDPKPPVASFDSYIGTGTGYLNGAPGATIELYITDAGENGKNDFADIVIRDADGNIVINISGNLEKGNHQAHGQDTVSQNPPKGGNG